MVHCCDDFALTSYVLRVAYFSIEITLEGVLCEKLSVGLGIFW